MKTGGTLTIAPDFVLRDQHRRARSLQSCLTGKPLILAFHRFYGCVVCQYDLDQLAKEYEAYRGQYGLAALVQTPSSELVGQPRVQGYDFPVLADPECLVYEAYQIPAASGKEQLNGGNSAEKVAAIKAAGYVHGLDTGDPLQLPALLLVEPDTRKILTALYCENVGEFPSIAQLLASKTQP